MSTTTHCRFCLEPATTCCDSCDREVCTDHRHGDPDQSLCCEACYLASIIDHDMSRHTPQHRAELATILGREQVWFGGKS